MSGFSITRSGADSASISILRTANEQFQTAQKRVSTGKMIFGAADDAARYRMSQMQASRARQIDRINNNVSLALKTLEATEATLNKINGLMEVAQGLTRKAQSEGLPQLYGIVSSSPISASSVIGGATPGARLSITSQTGENYVYVVRSTTDTWGEVVAELNNANIGVQADFIPSQTAGQTNIRFYAVNGRDFTFDGTSDQSIMDDLASVNWTNNSTGQQMNGVVNAQALFGVGGFAGLGETGFTVTYGGAIMGTKNVGAGTAVSAGSTLILEDGEGRVRTFAYTAGTTLGQIITDINNANFDIRAEFSNQASMGANEQLRLRNTAGGSVYLRLALGDFTSTGSVGIAPAVGTSVMRSAPKIADFSTRLRLGEQYNAALTEIDALIANNPVPQGRNLLTGANIAIAPDEFAGQPLLITGTRITVPGTLTLAQSGLSWGAANNIQTSAIQLNAAMSIIDDLRGRLGTFASYLQSRVDLSDEARADFRTISDELVGADMAEESAAMTSLQTRQQFAVQALSMGGRSDEGLLRLLG